MDGAAVIDTEQTVFPVNLAPLPDGGSVVYGWAGRASPVVSRLDARGRLDPTFDGDGRARIPRAVLDASNAVVAPPDGKILVTGRSKVGDAYDAAVFRLDRAGRLDATFDGDGERVLERGGRGAARALAIQPDGRILVAGTGVYRLDPGGVPDPSFGAGGRAAVAPGVLSAVAVQPDGRIVVAGVTGRGAVVARLLADGTLDRTFRGGTVVIERRFATAVAVQPDSKVLVLTDAVREDEAAAVHRLDANGAVDPGFGRGGTVRLPSAALALALQPDGRIVVAGPPSSGSEAGTLLRLLSDGTRDPAFAPGWLRRRSPLVLTGPLGLQADGKILLGGLKLVDADRAHQLALRVVGAPSAPPPPAGAAPDTIGPQVIGTRLTVTGRRATLRFTLTEPASVDVSIARGILGRAVGDACVKTRRRRGQACIRGFADVAELSRGDLPAGRHTIRIRRRRDRALLTGRYHTTITATDAAGNTS